MRNAYFAKNIKGNSIAAFVALSYQHEYKKRGKIARKSHVAVSASLSVTPPVQKVIWNSKLLSALMTDSFRLQNCYAISF